MTTESVLARQAGVISRPQAIAEGMSASTIDRRVLSGLWRSLHPRVYLSSDHKLTDEARLRGASLWAEPDAIVSGLAAAWWHGLCPIAPRVIEITVALGRRLSAPPGVRLRRRDLPAADRTEVRGVRVTPVPLTVLEAAVELGSAGSQLLDRALQRHTNLPALYRAQSRNLGRRGSARAAELLRAAADRAASQAERVVVRLLRDAGVAGWRIGYPVNGFDVDLAFPTHRVAIEIDGWAWHSDVARFRRDRRRQNAIVLAGWTILRFTWHDLTERPAAVIAEIRMALAGPAA
jgi:very-short-patch-repair endonuclease